MHNYYDDPSYDPNSIGEKISDANFEYLKRLKIEVISAYKDMIDKVTKEFINELGNEDAVRILLVSIDAEKMMIDGYTEIMDEFSRIKSALELNEEYVVKLGKKITKLTMDNYKLKMDIGIMESSEDSDGIAFAKKIINGDVVVDSVSRNGSIVSLTGYLAR